LPSRGDFNANQAFSDCIDLAEGVEVKETLALGACATTTLSITEAAIIAGEKVEVVVDGPGEYTWSPATVVETINDSTFLLMPAESNIFTVSSSNYFSCGAIYYGTAIYLIGSNYRR